MTREELVEGVIDKVKKRFGKKYSGNAGTIQWIKDNPDKGRVVRGPMLQKSDGSWYRPRGVESPKFNLRKK